MSIFDSWLKLYGKRKEYETQGMLRAQDAIRGQRGGMDILGNPAQPATPPTLVEHGRMTLPLGGTEAVEGTGYLGGKLNRQQAVTSMLDEGYSVPEVNNLFGSYNDIQKQDMLRSGLSPNEYASQIRGMAKDRATAMAPFQNAAVGYNQMGNLLDKFGGIQNLDNMPGTFDLALQRNYIKGLSVLRPEAYMQDDAIQSFMAVNKLDDEDGLWRFLNNMTIGDIKLGNKGRREMLKSYNTIMQENFAARDAVDEPFRSQANVLFPGQDTSGVFGSNITEYNPDLLSVPPEPYQSKPEQEFVPDPRSNLTPKMQQRREELRAMAKEEKKNSRASNRSKR